MKLADALFNWLQITIVAEARPADKSAQETVLFFEKILKEDHEIIELKKEMSDAHYTLHYIQQGEKKAETIFRESAEQLLRDILAEPRYN